MALTRERSRAATVGIEQVRSVGGPRAALELVCGLFADAVEEQARRDVEAWMHEGIDAVPYTDHRFPPRLVEIRDAPSIVFRRGELVSADLDGVAVIGTRHPSPEGIERARAVARALVAAGRTVVSGLAAGIDTAAHATALEAGGRSLAVLGNGLHHCYPPANAGLQQRMSVLVSQFLPDQAPSRDSFPQRNAVMSGITAATVIVEAGERSGARIQARHAISQHRPLFLMRQLLDRPWAREMAAQDGVRVVDGPGDVIAGLVAWTG